MRTYGASSPVSTRRVAGGIGAFLIFATGSVLVAEEPASSAVASRSVQAQRADDFVESIGVNTHVRYTDKPYRNIGLVRQRIQEMGIRYVRDDVGRPDLLNQLGDVKIVGMVEARTGRDPARLDFTQLDAAVNRAKQVNNLIALEGPNEYDVQKNVDWIGELRQWMDRFNAAVNQDERLATLPVLMPSLGHDWDSSAKLGPSLADTFDIGNFHPYPGGQLPSNQLDTRIQRLKANMAANGDKPMWATETGYHYSTTDRSSQPGVTDRVGGMYTPRLYAEYFRAGVAKTFNYELLSEGPASKTDCSECLYGLLDDNLNYRPSGNAVKNMIGLLGEKGQNSFVPGSLTYGMEGDTRVVKDLLLQKSDGTFFVLVWQDISLYKSYVGELPYNEPGVVFSFPVGYTTAKVRRFDVAGNLRLDNFPIVNGRMKINVQPALMMIELAPISTESAATTSTPLTTAATSSSSTTALVGTSSTVPSQPGEWRLMWSDEFDGTELNSQKWSVEEGGNIRDREFQLYRKENVAVSDGNLVITTNKETINGRDYRSGAQVPFQYTSGSLTSSGKYSFLYGGIDIRAKLPTGPGIWPVLWLLGDKCPRGAIPGSCQWPRKGAEEIDLVELGKTSFSATKHTAYWGKSAAAGDLTTFECLANLPEVNVRDFQVYTVIWEPAAGNSTKLTWLINDKEVCERIVTDEGFFKSPMYIYLNTAIGVSGQPNSQTVFPQRLLVDYVKVFSRL